MRRNVFSRVFLPGAAVVTGGLLAAGLMTASAAAATSPASAAAPAQQWLLADQRAEASLTGGVITGIAEASADAPLEGICVTAVGTSGDRSAMTRQDGRFLISGLRPGWYSLRYRDCGHPGQYLSQWYGGTMTRTGSRPVLVGGSGLVPVAPVTLRHPAASGGPAGLSAASAEPPRSPLARMLADQAGGQRTSVAPVRGGRIAGRVTDRHGHPLQGICVVTFRSSGGAAEAKTGPRGYYVTAKLAPGRYLAVFYAGCGNTGNWLAQAYKNAYDLAKATLIRVRAAKTTQNINAVLQPGGEITGTVTNAAGRKLSNICVDALPSTFSYPYEFVLPTRSRDGAFRVRGLPAGIYRLLFLPCTSGSDYAAVWWKNSVTPQHARAIRVKDGQIVSRIDQVIPLGGTITGVVTAGSLHGPRLAGICVGALASSGEIYPGNFTATRANGTYALRGLEVGRYQVQFSPGCGNNGNYLPAIYPRPIRVASGKTVAGINGVLPLGARISGVVSDSHGLPIPGICVTVSGANGEFFNGTQTSANGSYAVDQLEAGTYVIQFYGGCGNPGSYAPQGYNGTNLYAPQPVQVGPAQLLSGINAVMQPGATIGGSVTSTSGKPQNGVCVFATTPGLVDSIEPVGLAGIGIVLGVQADGSAETADGRYQITNLEPGQYEIAFLRCGSNADLAAQWYSARPGAGPAAIVYAGGKQPTGEIDTVMQAAGSISGTMRSASGRKVFACVQATNLNPGVQLPVNETIAFGSYQLNGLPPGAYQVRFLPGCFGFGGPGYATQWYSGKPSPAGAARVIVRAGRTTTGIDAALTVGGSITGLVTSAATHVPLGNICVIAQNVTQQEEVGLGVTVGSHGRYAIHGLNSGRYQMDFFPCVESPSPAEQIRPSLVTVVAPRVTRGIDAALAVGGTIAGQVTAGSPATPGQALCVAAFNASGQLVGSAVTDAAGNFQIPGLSPGRYLVYFGDPACPDGPYDVVPQWYSGQSSRVGATLVRVANGQVTSGIDANLALDGSITGTVTGPGGLLTGVCVSAVGTGAGATPVVAVTAQGGYTIGELAPGPYRVEFSSGCGAAGYATQWWQNASSAAGATIITVSAGATVTGIGAALHR